LFDELDIVGAGVEVLDGEMVADLRASARCRRMGPNLVQIDDSRAAVVAWMAWRGGFPPLLCLRDQISSNIRVGVRS
jgi:hypothetical protein